MQHQQMRDDRHPHVTAIVDKIKSEGIFDALRKDCLAEVDLKPAYQNLKQKVENACATFLSRVMWTAKLNKNQLREQMRKNLEDSGVLQSGVRRLVNQVVTPIIDQQVKPKVAQVVCEYLGLDPDDIHTEEDDEFEEAGSQDLGQAPVGLYPFNLLEPPPTACPAGLPGFDEYDKRHTAPTIPLHSVDEGTAPSSSGQEVRFEEPQAKEEVEAKLDVDKTSDKQDDMDISDRSDSRSTSRASTKKSMDMDCAMTSDEESGAAGVDGTDLSKGLAGYMATTTGSPRNEDDMSISSGTSSKREQITPEPADDTKDSMPTSESALEKRKSGRRDSTKTDQPVQPERREMKRLRTRNKKYMSDDFESIFTEKRELLGDAYNQDYVEEEIITTDDLMSQVVIEETETSGTTKRLSERASPKTSESPEHLHPRRSSRHRGAKATSAENTANIKLPGEPAKPKTEPATERKRALRSSKSTAGLPEQTDNAASVGSTAPRRFTRSASKYLGESAVPSRSTRADGRDSAGSTPTQDEHTDLGRHATLDTILPSLVVLSDICAGQARLPSLTDDVPARESPTKPALCDAPEQLEPGCTEPQPPDGTTETTNPTASSSDDANDTQSYEPELHFDEMSRAFAEQAGPSSSRSDVATPTMDEPASPDRLTESPTSPAPSSPTEECFPIASAAVTIPLEGDDSYHSVIEQPSTMPLIPTDCVSDAKQPPLPPELPPLPMDPDHTDSPMPPPEPEDEEDEGPAVYQVLSEVGADDGSSPPEYVEVDHAAEAGEAPEVASEDIGEQDVEEEEEEEDDLEELERLAQRKLEILKAIELPDSVLERSTRDPSSEEEEGEISDSSEDDRSRSKKKKSKKSKKKKSKKESRKRKHHDHDMVGASKRRRHH